MSLLEILENLFFKDNCQPGHFNTRRPEHNRNDKHIIVKQNGCEKRYRIDKYGEVYEE